MSGASCYDASALVRLYVPTEEKADVVVKYFNTHPTKYTTVFCFFEALSVLKGKWGRGDLLKEGYFKAVQDLTSWYRVWSQNIPDLKFTERDTFADAKRIAERWSLDMSDAFQILSVKAGFFAPLVGDSKTVLVTADRKLGQAARGEALRVWSVLDEAPP
jgi:predicted nucleic acid-binding protein